MCKRLYGWEKSQPILMHLFLAMQEQQIKQKNVYLDKMSGIMQGAGHNYNLMLSAVFFCKKDAKRFYYKHDIGEKMMNQKWNNG